jgi:hypothetical protein
MFFEAVAKDPTVYVTMQGHSEVNITGNLKGNFPSPIPVLSLTIAKPNRLCRAMVD